MARDRPAGGVRAALAALVHPQSPNSHVVRQVDITVGATLYGPSPRHAASSVDSRAALRAAEGGWGKSPVIEVVDCVTDPFLLARGGGARMSRLGIGPGGGFRSGEELVGLVHVFLRIGPRGSGRVADLISPASTIHLSVPLPAGRGPGARHVGAGRAGGGIRAGTPRQPRTPAHSGLVLLRPVPTLGCSRSTPAPTRPIGPSLPRPLSPPEVPAMLDKAKGREEGTASRWVDRPEPAAPASGPVRPTNTRSGDAPVRARSTAVGDSR